MSCRLVLIILYITIITNYIYKMPLKYETSYILMIGSVLPFRVDVGNKFACIADRNLDCNMLRDASSTEN